MQARAAAAQRAAAERLLFSREATEMKAQLSALLLESCQQEQAADVNPKP